jgi:hypothetical protein
MGEPTTFRASFRPSLRIEVRDDGLSSFGGVAYLREFEERTGFFGDLLSRLKDPRMSGRVAHHVADLLRLAVYAKALGYPDIADADVLRFDPVLRSVLAPGGQDRVGEPLAAKSTLHRFLTDVLVLRENRRALVEAVLETGLRPLLAKGRAPRRLYVDLDSTMSEVHGEQEGSANNGYFRTYCYHPLVLSIAKLGTVLGFLLRPGNAPTGEHATLFVLPLLRRLRSMLPARVEIVLRADSGFSDPVLFEALEREGFFYIVRLRENARLLRKAARIEKRAVGRPSKSFSAYRHLSFRYAAASWSKDRRVVARAEFEPGTLFADWTFLCVHLPKNTKRRLVMRAYLGRGESEQVNDVFKNELRGDLLSQRRMGLNQIRGLLTALAQNLLVAFDDSTRRRRRRRRPSTIRAKVLLVATTVVRHARSLYLRVSAAGKRARSFARLALAVAACRPPPRLSTA